MTNATDPIAVLKELVAIPSVNPMGRDVSGPEYFEENLTRYLLDFFERLGLPCEQRELAAGRSNLLARFDSPDSDVTILLDAHQDTVPTDGMTIDPFDPVVKEGRLYGRGACDVKGGMAAMLAAVARLAHERPSGAANVFLSLSCDEEATILGVRDLAEQIESAGQPDSQFSRRPDVAVVAEPTDLNVVVAHRGATRWKIRTAGRACHSSRPENGINAIYRMARVVRALEDYAAELGDQIPPHPLCGPATLSVGRIEGGVSVNTVPDFCEIEIDRRVIPGEDGRAVMEPVREYLAERIDVPFEFSPPWITGSTLSDADNGPWADRLLTHIAAVVGPREKVGVAYGTNASRISTAGVPSMVFGPGSIEQAHTKDEWIDLGELEQAAEIYYRFCTAGSSKPV